MQYDLRSNRQFQNPTKRTVRYSNSFFPFCISEWEKLADDIKTLPTLAQFKKNLLLFIRPTKRLSFGIGDIEGMKMITKLRVEFSDLRSHRYHHNLDR